MVLGTNQMEKMVTGKEESKNSMVRSLVPKKATSVTVRTAGVGKGSVLFVHSTFPLPCPSLSVFIHSIYRYISPL